MGINQAFLGELDYEAATTRRMLERVPMDKFGWKPHDKSMSMGQLAIHIAQLPGFAPLTMTTPHFDLGSTGDPHKQPEFKTNKELVDFFDGNIGQMRDALSTATDEALREPWSLKSGDQVIFTLPRAGVMRSMILNHIVHHRGQLSVYLRLNNVPVPSIYGPSADEQS
jgi:uncharacterized damage-inducible protein DinB